MKREKVSNFGWRKSLTSVQRTKKKRGTSKSFQNRGCTRNEVDYGIDLLAKDIKRQSPKPPRKTIIYCLSRK